MTVMGTYFINCLAALLIGSFFCGMENSRLLKTLMVFLFYALAWYQGTMFVALAAQHRRTMALAGTARGWVWWAQIAPLEMALMFLLAYIFFRSDKCRDRS